MFDDISGGCIRSNEIPGSEFGSRVNETIDPYGGSR